MWWSFIISVLKMILADVTSLVLQHDDATEPYYHLYAAKRDIESAIHRLQLVGKLLDEIDKTQV